MVYSPRRLRSTTERSERPIRRSISMERPLRLARSRLVRRLVDAGSMAYSAVTQPARELRRQAGTPSSTVAVHRTRVSPNVTRHDPSAFFIMLRSRVTGRIWSHARSNERAACVSAPACAVAPACVTASTCVAVSACVTAPGSATTPACAATPACAGFSSENAPSTWLFIALLRKNATPEGAA